MVSLSFLVPVLILFKFKRTNLCAADWTVSDQRSFQSNLTMTDNNRSTNTARRWKAQKSEAIVNCSSTSIQSFSVRYVGFLFVPIPSRQTTVAQHDGSGKTRSNRSFQDNAPHESKFKYMYTCPKALLNKEDTLSSSRVSTLLSSVAQLIPPSSSWSSSSSNV